ncbi:hypothetical protein M3Y95_01229400 [Aphelenchoides besseyi]|nr:hypothetical protein M3Y95_01229400 [Aphelenchoides besseyi]
MSSLNDTVEFDRYFYANVTNQSFDQTPTGIFYRINNMVSFGVGLISICLYFYMIRFKTPRSFRAYSKLLTFCLIVDASCCILYFCGQSRYKGSTSYGITVFDGPASLLDRKGQCLFQYFYLLLPPMQSLALSIIAFYRHQHVKYKVAPSTRQLLMYVAIATIPLVLSIIFSSISGYETQEITVEIIRSWPPETPLPKNFVVLNYKANQYALIGFTYRRFVCYGAFVLTICISLASVRLLRREWPSMNKNSKSTQRTFNRILVAEAMIPFVSILLPMGLINIFAWFNAPSYALEWAVQMIKWSVALNCICSLLIVAPYRRELSHIFLRCFRSYTTSSSPVTIFSTSKLT